MWKKLIFSYIDKELAQHPSHWSFTFTTIMCTEWCKWSSTNLSQIDLMFPDIVHSSWSMAPTSIPFPYGNSPYLVPAQIEQEPWGFHHQSLLQVFSRSNSTTKCQFNNLWYNLVWWVLKTIVKRGKKKQMLTLCFHKLVTFLLHSCHSHLNLNNSV
jgi:hypothetical protein